MRLFLEKIHKWIYAKTGVFDNVFFSLPVVFVIMLIYWFARCAIHKHKFGTEYKEIRRRSLINEIIRLCFVVWIAEIVCLTLTPSYFWDFVWQNIINDEIIYPGMKWFSCNSPKLTPILVYYIGQGHLDWLFHSKTVILELAVNVALFVPLGLALPFIFKKVSLLKAAIIGLSCSFSIEFLQCFISNRDSTVDDLLCNTLGAVIGYLLYLLIKKLFPNFTEKGKTSADELWRDRRLKE